jgi:hypothetical protein
VFTSCSSVLRSCPQNSTSRPSSKSRSCWFSLGTSGKCVMGAHSANKSRSVAALICTNTARECQVKRTGTTSGQMKTASDMGLPVGLWPGSHRIIREQPEGKEREEQQEERARRQPTSMTRFSTPWSLSRPSWTLTCSKVEPSCMVSTSDFSSQLGSALPVSVSCMDDCLTASGTRGLRRNAAQTARRRADGSKQIKRSAPARLV